MSLLPAMVKLPRCSSKPPVTCGASQVPRMLTASPPTRRRGRVPAPAFPRRLDGDIESDDHLCLHGCRALPAPSHVEHGDVRRQRVRDADAARFT